MAEIEAAWNGHDMSRLAACFADDADFVSVLGAWWRGRGEIAQSLARQHAGRFKDSTMQLRLAAFKEIVPGVAVMHVRWEMEGHERSGPRPTAGTRSGIWSWIVRARDGEVEIVSSHNTDVVSPQSNPAVMSPPPE